MSDDMPDMKAEPGDDEFELRGRPRQRETRTRLTRHFPIRFSPETLARIKSVADRDGVTVASWVRRVIDRELERRLPHEPATELRPRGVVTFSPSEPMAETTNDLVDNDAARLEIVG
jgi:hypothetical protein